MVWLSNCPDIRPPDSRYDALTDTKYDIRLDIGIADTWKHIWLDTRYSYQISGRPDIRSFTESNTWPDTGYIEA